MAFAGDLLHDTVEDTNTDYDDILEEFGACSRVFLDEAVRRMREAGYGAANLDCTVICDSPKISAIKKELRASIENALGVAAERVNVKGMTHELLADREDKAVEVRVVTPLGRAAR